MSKDTPGRPLQPEPEERARPRSARRAPRGSTGGRGVAVGKGGRGPQPKPKPASFRARYAAPWALVRGALGRARRDFTANFGRLLIGSALWLVPFCYLSYVAVAFTLGIVGGSVQSLPVQAAVLLVWATLLTPIQVGFAHVSLRVEAGERPRVAHFFRFPNAVRALATALLANVLIIVGLALFVIPGLLVGIMCVFAVTVAVERGPRPLAAIQASSGLVATNAVAAMLLGLALGLLVVLGYLLLSPLGILMLFAPVVIAAPVLALTVANAYRTVEGMAAR